MSIKPADLLIDDIPKHGQSHLVDLSFSRQSKKSQPHPCKQKVSDSESNIPSCYLCHGVFEIWEMYAIAVVAYCEVNKIIVLCGFKKAIRHLTNQYKLTGSYNAIKDATDYSEYDQNCISSIGKTELKIKEN